MAKKLSFPAKITQPVNTGILLRKRLYKQIDLKRRTKIIWVEGPPGAGKTTLVSSYIKDSGAQCIWYQLDAGDADPASFFFYMGMAVKNAVPRKRRPMPLLTPEYMPGIAVFTRRYFEELCSRIKTPFILVFDNYQEVPIKSLFHEIIVHGIDAVPENINIIFISRTGIPVPMARLRANKVIGTLGWEQLRLTVEETKAVIKLGGHKNATRDSIKRLYDKTDGWIAGLTLMLKNEISSGRETAAPEASTPKVIFDYFAGELFRSMDRDTQEFLLKTSLLPDMSVKMAKELTGQSRSGKILSDLSSNNYFTVKRPLHNTVYVYHPLFREFLLAYAEDTFSPSQLQKIKHTAALILEENNRPEDSFELFMQSRDIERTINIVLKHAPGLVAQGRFMVLSAWLARLPKKLLTSVPWLVYWSGVCRMFVAPADANSFFEKAFYMFREQNDTSGMLLSWSGAVDSIMYEFGSFKEFDRWIALYNKELKDMPFPGTEVEARVTVSMLSAMVFIQPVHPDLDDWIDRGLALLTIVPDISLKVMLYLPAVISGISSGDLEKTEHYLKMFEHITRSPDVTPFALVTKMDLEAFYYWHAARFEECLDTVDKGLKIAADNGVHLIDYLLLFHGATGALSTGNTEKAEVFIEMFFQRLDVMGSYQKSIFHIIKIWHALLTGNIAQGIFHSETALKLSLDTGTPFNICTAYMGSALVMQKRGSREESQDNITKALDIARRNNFRQLEFCCLLIKAQLAFEEENESEGLEILSSAMSIGKEQRYMNFVFWQSDLMADLCVRALDAGIEVEYVTELIKDRNIMPAEPPVEIETWPWSLRIYTLGRFEIMADGRAVRFSGKSQKKPLEMLKALIAFGGKDVSADAVTDALWPEAAGDTARQSFRTTLHRLRKLLGNDSAINFQEGRLFFDHNCCWLDTWAFERCLELYDNAFAEKQMERSISLCKRTIDLYKGHFLENDVVESWTISYRERLKSRFLRHIGKYGRLLEDTGQWSKAAECYQKALEVDDLAEEFYRHLMVCDQRLGKRAEAIEAYNRCCNTLSSILRVQPSPETTAVYRSLLS